MRGKRIRDNNCRSAREKFLNIATYRRGMCLGVLRAEFRLVQFRLQYTNAADFAESPWLGVPIVLVYRTVIAAFCTAVLIGSGLYYSGNKGKWFIFLTNWSFFFVTLYYICATIVTGVHFKNRYQQQQNVITDGNENDRSLQMGVMSEDKEPRSCVDVESEAIVIADPSEASRIIQMRWFHQALWVIYNIASTAALLVTISFYTFFRGAGAMSVFTHGVNSILVVIDTMLSSIPVRLFHVVYPALYFIVYLIFTLIYWAAGQPYIYPMTDYTGQPVFSAITVVCLFFIALPLCQTLMFGFYCLRVWMETKCC